MLTTFYFSLSLHRKTLFHYNKEEMRRRLNFFIFLNCKKKIIKFPPSLDTKSLPLVSFIPQRNKKHYQSTTVPLDKYIKLRTHDSYFFEKRNGLPNFVATFCSGNYCGNF